MRTIIYKKKVFIKLIENMWGPQKNMKMVKIKLIEDM